jgi:hypothetical protein
MPIPSARTPTILQVSQQNEMGEQGFRVLNISSRRYIRPTSLLRVIFPPATEAVSIETFSGSAFLFFELPPDDMPV